jgi:acyl-CoA thioester hydrolase
VSDVTGADATSLGIAAPSDGYRVDLRWRDLDHQGHVYHATILTILDEARTAWLAAKVAVQQPDSYVVARIELDYRNPLLRTDLGVVAHFRPVRIGNSSVTIREELHSARTGVLIAESLTTVVMWDQVTAAARSVSTEERRNMTDDHERLEDGHT